MTTETGIARHVNYYPHHLGDYDGATAHLSWDEDCAYRRLLGVYYRLERPLPADKGEIYRLIRAQAKPHQKAADRVLTEFFDLRDDGWHNKRADKEIAQWKDKSGKSKYAAGKRWCKAAASANASPKALRTDMRPHSVGNANQSQSQSQSQEGGS